MSTDEKPAPEEAFPTVEQIVTALIAWCEEGPPTTYPEQTAAMRRALIAAASIKRSRS